MSDAADHVELIDNYSQMKRDDRLKRRERATEKFLEEWRNTPEAKQQLDAYDKRMAEFRASDDYPNIPF